MTTSITTTGIFSISNANLTAIATRDSSSNVYLLVVSSGQESYTVNADLSALTTVGTGTMWEFSSKVMDEIVGNLTLNDGHVIFTIPAKTAILISFKQHN